MLLLTFGQYDHEHVRADSMGRKCDDMTMPKLSRAMGRLARTRRQTELSAPDPAVKRALLGISGGVCSLKYPAL